MTGVIQTPRSGERIGIIVPSSNTNLEPDCAMLVPQGVTTYFARIGGYDVDAIAGSGQMRVLANASLDNAIDLLMDAKVQVIGYGCVSASLSCGLDFDRQMRREIESRAGVPAVTAAGAIIDTLRTLKISRIGFASPYVDELNAEAIRFFRDAEIEVVRRASPDTPLSSIEQGRLTPNDVYELGCAANHQCAEAIVISCTDIRAVETANALQRQLAKPVITANHALISKCLLRINSCIGETVD